MAEPLGQFLLKALPRELDFDAVVPMPLHWTKHWRRGFNQSELLARVVSRRWNVPVKRLVRRTRATPVQAGLTSSKRRLNVLGAFRASNVAGLKVLLVDDVLTTGATAGACAAALKRAGAARVTLLTLARADRRFAVPALRDTVSVPESTIFGSLNDAKPGSIA